MKKRILGYAIVAILGILSALVVSSIFQPSWVQGSSMYPTVKDQSLVLMNKVAYLLEEPKVGDIVVFKSHIYTDSGEGKLLIKRVIGVEGDRISITDGKVYRNSKVVEESYVNSTERHDNMEEITVEKGKIFVMGDNRNSSLDSRDVVVGQVDRTSILGKVDVRLLPIKDIGTIQ